jgi:hypothetical protein
MADTPVTPSGKTAKPNGQNAQQVQPSVTTEDINNRETVEKLAFHIWAALAAEKLLSPISGLADKLIESPLLDDDDDEEADGEEADEGWFNDNRKREKEWLDGVIANALDTYPDISSINNAVNNAIEDLPPLLNSDPEIRAAAEQLKNRLEKCAIGATKFKERFSRPLLERMVMIELEKQFKNNPKYSEHIREDVPGRDIKKYGDQRRTSSKGTFYKSAGYLDGGGLAIRASRNPPRDAQRAYWLSADDARAVLAVARRNGGNVILAAQACGVGLTDHHRMVQRARAALARLDAQIAQAQRAGLMNYLNIEYRQRRLQAQAAGRVFIPYRAAQARFRKAVIDVAAGAPPAGLMKRVFDDRLPDPQ